MNIFKNLSTVAAGAVFITLGATGAAQAVTVAGSSSGVFGTPSPGNDPTRPFSGVGTNTVTWGENSKANPINSLSFAGTTFSNEINAVFQVGNLTYFNGDTDVPSNVDSVPLNVSLAISSPSSFTKVLPFNFDLVTREGDEPDSVYPINDFASSSFNLGGVEYTLQLTGFSKDGGATVLDEFYIEEYATDTAIVYGRITAAPPPTEIPFEFSPSLGILLLGAWGAISQLNSQVQKHKSSARVFSKN